jgi:phosphoribosyl 1,2-cyclic phosphodiesterase
VRLTLLGVRGSTPAPGAEFVRYGGHTSCVAITADDAAVPTLVLDAGTGLRTLTPLLGGRAFEGSIVVSHLHWDHVEGLPFFMAGDRPDARVDFCVPAQGGRSGRDLLAATMSPPSFPITPEGLNGRWRFRALADGAHTLEGFDVRAFDVRHKGGRTFGYRVSDEHGSVAYIPDHVCSAGVEDDVRSLLAGVDVLLHDAQFVASERAMADAYGHSTVDDAIDLAVSCGARSLVLFHHSPARTDDAVDEIVAALDPPLPVTAARQGVEIAVGLSAAPLANP